MKKPLSWRAPRSLLLGGITACMVLSHTASADEQEGPPVPTENGFGVAYQVDAASTWKRYGDLLCENDKRENCSVANMPLLAQADHSFVAPLTAEVKQFANAKGEVSVLTGAGVQTFTVDHAVQGQLNNGCWMTSQTTLIETAIANHPKLPLTGRLLAWAGLGASAGLGLTKPQNQLLWQYMRQADWTNGQVKHTQPPPPTYISLKEFVGDLSASGVKEGHLGNTHVESPAIVSALKGNQMVAFQYGRYQANVGAPGKDGHRALTFTRVNQHKVAVSGFRPGTYPVVINDVGDGKRHLVRVTANWQSLKFTLKGAGGSVTTLDASKLDIDPKFAGRSFVAYEGAEEITLNDPHGKVFFLDDCPTLSVP